MTNEEINRYIHEQIMGKCWHEFEVYRAIHGNDKCLKGCGADRFDGSIREMDYCSDDSPRRLLNEVVAKVITVVNSNEYWVQINRVVDVCPEGLVSVLQATAEQIARACVKAHQGAK